MIDQIFTQFFINCIKHRINLLIKYLAVTVVRIDPFVIFLLPDGKCLIKLRIHLQIWFSIRPFNDIDSHIMDDLRIDLTDSTVLKRLIICDQPEFDRILSVLPQICNNIGNTHDTAFQCGRDQFLRSALLRITHFHLLIKHLKICIRLRLIFLHFHLAIMADDPIQCLQAQIHRKDSVKHPRTVNIMVKIASCMIMINLAELPLPLMSKRRMTDVMSDRNCLDQIQIQVQRLSNVTRCSRYKLYMRCASGNIIVFIQRKHLCFIRITVIIRDMHDLFTIPDKCRAPDCLLIMCHIPADHVFIGTCIWIFYMVLPVFPDSFLKFFGKWYIIFCLAHSFPPVFLSAAPDQNIWCFSICITLS